VKTSHILVFIGILCKISSWKWSVLSSFFVEILELFYYFICHSEHREESFYLPPAGYNPLSRWSGISPYQGRNFCPDVSGLPDEIGVRGCLQMKNFFLMSFVVLLYLKEVAEGRKIFIFYCLQIPSVSPCPVL